MRREAAAAKRSGHAGRSSVYEGGGGGGGRRYARSAAAKGGRLKSGRGYAPLGSPRREDDARARGRAETPSMPFVVRCLARKQMLPAIVFIFSRAGCDAAAEAAAETTAALLSAEQRSELRRRVAEFREAHADLPWDDARLGLLESGVAAHHAGMLPLEKSLAEALFQAGLLRAVFATETLAAGINMPARSTVISVLSKRGDLGIQALEPTQLLQMAGRAGRRGMDEQGHVVICRSRFEGASEAHALLLRPAGPLSSRLSVSYGSALKVLRTKSLPEVEALVRRSFAAFLATERDAEAETEEARVASQLAAACEVLAPYSEEGVAEYAKLTERLSAEQRAEDYLMAQEAQAAQEVIETVLPFVQAGAAAVLADGSAALLLDDAPEPLGAALAARTESPVLLLLRDGRLVVAAARHLAALYPEEGIQFEAGALGSVLAALPPRPAWRLRADGALESRAELAPEVQASLERLASQVPTDLPPGEVASSAALEKQAARVRRLCALRDEAATLLFGSPASHRLSMQSSMAAGESAVPEKRPWESHGEAVLGAYRARGQLSVRAAQLKRRGGGGGGGGGTARRSGTSLDNEDDEAGGAWRRFLAVCAVLHEYAALPPGWDSAKGAVQEGTEQPAEQREQLELGELGASASTSSAWMNRPDYISGTLPSTFARRSRLTTAGAFWSRHARV